MAKFDPAAGRRATMDAGRVWSWWGRSAAALVALALLTWPLSTAEAQQSVRPPAGAVVPATPGAPPPPGAEKPSNYDIDLWKKLRSGTAGNVSIPDKKAGVLVQTEGEMWRNLRNGPLTLYGAYAMAGMLGLIVLFFVVRGRVRIEHGWSDQTLVRFTTFERMAHWLLATSFIILALTGLNVLYGRYLLPPIIGKEAFAQLSYAGKLVHSYVAFAFMVALVMTFVRWVIYNMPSWRDAVWVAKGGGMIKGVHPPSWKFNAGQKILFWLVILGGVSISLSGLSMMLPDRLPMFAKTFGWINAVLGTSLPTTLTTHQEMQLAVTWHGIMALFLVCVILGHIYIGTLGMQGAFAAMGSGRVDVNWAKEHHSLWAERELQAMAAAAGDSMKPPASKMTPAE